MIHEEIEDFVAALPTVFRSTGGRQVTKPSPKARIHSWS